MITREQYFQAKPHTDENEADADSLLTRVNALRAEWCALTGRAAPIDPDTGTEISGSKGGNGDGGFRLQAATTGRPNSPHKKARGVDDFDPGNELDDWISEFEDGKGGNSKLEGYGLYREHPDDTPGWVHFQDIAPRSGHRTFKP